MNQNPRFDPSQTNNPRAMRSEIDSTRQRIDQKIDAIGERLKGRHLVDEVVGFFRSKNGNGESGASRLTHKVTDSAGQAMHAVADSVKKHPLPAALIGAGIAWYIYQSTRPKSPASPARHQRSEEHYDGPPYDPDFVADAPFGYTSAQLHESEAFHGSPGTFFEDEHTDSPGVSQRLSEKASDLKQRAQQKASAVSARVKESAQRIRQRAGEVGTRVQQRAGQIYTRSRDEVARTAENHPLEVGLGLLGIGLIAGLALPTPRKMDELVGPTADRLRQRARDKAGDLMQRGKQIARAAGSAAKDELQTQGHTPIAAGSSQQGAPESMSAAENAS